ncbi:sigma factor [Streptomyces fructofermentans]|uniref:sigma factor n=1 Tax=Streptomyces fructofermentans TaxID=152141 RepID=UPI003788A1C3
MTVGRAEEFEELRPLLLCLAHRILGSARGAQDAVQETWLRWQTCAPRPGQSRAFLAAAVTRIAAEALRTARIQRGDPVGPWLPEPLPGDPHRDPEEPAELAESLVTATLLALERLSPLERAVLVLREVFGCALPQVTSAVGCSEAAGRQLAAAVRLASDGGGTTLPWPARITGAATVARVLTAIIPPLVRIGVTVEQNHAVDRPEVILRDRNGRVLHALELGILDGRIHTVHLAAAARTTSWTPPRPPRHDSPHVDDPPGHDDD